MDTFELIRAERVRLADELATLSDDEWRQPSLCEGWTTHVVAAHLNLPWAIGRPQFLWGVLKARGNVDRAMDHLSREHARRTPPQACVDELRAHAGHRFTPPLFGPEAPLTDVIVHGADILQPLGRHVAVSDEALTAVLTFLTGGKARPPFAPRKLDGVRIHVTDLDRQLGDGPAEITGPALAVCGTLLHRRGYASQLDGPGVALLG